MDSWISSSDHFKNKMACSHYHQHHQRLHCCSVASTLHLENQSRTFGLIVKLRCVCPTPFNKQVCGRPRWWHDTWPPFHATIRRWGPLKSFHVSGRCKIGKETIALSTQSAMYVCRLTKALTVLKFVTRLKVLPYFFD